MAVYPVGYMVDYLEICKVFGKQYPALIPENYLSVIGACGLDPKDSSLPWQDIVGANKFKQLQTTFDQNLSEVLGEIGTDIDYYNLVYSKTSRVFDHLQPARVNLVNYKLALSSKEDNASRQHLESWKPDSRGFLEVPQYNISDSLTGRMKITSGPNILLLPKELRKILTSRHGKNGSLWYFDYVSLEPRVALSIYYLLRQEQCLIGSLPLPDLLKRPADETIEKVPEDVYTWALKKLKLSSDIDRGVLKQIVLPQIYGQSKANTLESLSQKNIYRPEEIVEMVNDFFGIDTVRQHVFLELQKNGYKFLRTFYGRHVCPDDSKPYKLFNLFVQSAAVDVALFGFGKILDKLANIESAKGFISPVFFIHDAMVLDIHNDLQHIVPKLCDLGSRNIPGFPEQTFYMSANKL